MRLGRILQHMEVIQIREAGHYRVRLEHDDDWIVIFLPLSEDGTLDGRRPSPYLFKAAWDSTEYYGELHIRSDGNRLEWGADAPDSLTDLMTAPIRGVGTIVKVWETDDRNSDSRAYRVRSLVKL